MNRDGTFVIDKMSIRSQLREHFMHNIGSSEEVIVNICEIEGVGRKRVIGDEKLEGYMAHSM